MKPYWYINKNFLQSRVGRIGASDIPALVPNPEKPNETLAGYGRTPVSVWMEKTGRKTRDAAGIPAEIGSHMEVKELELFIRQMTGAQAAREFYRNYMIYELNAAESDAAMFQDGPFRHHAQRHENDLIAHPDCVYDPDFGEAEGAYIDGVKVNPKKPFLIEAKNASFWSARRGEAEFSGYGFDDSTESGIPLKHYLQIQFQLALFDVDDAYLSLVHNTNQWNVWHVRRNPNHSDRMMDLASKMVWHIKRDHAPRDMALNQQDVIDLYPTIGDDFVIINGEERETALKLAKVYQHHERQAKAHKSKADEAKDAMAALLKDRPELRDDIGPIAKWQTRKASERVLGLKDILSTYPAAYKYLKRNKLISETAESRFVSIKRKEFDE